MHVYFSGIGGTGIGPLALIAKEAGYDVSGSDIKDSRYIKYLRDHGISDISIGQTKEAIEATNKKKPIDWLVYSSAVSRNRNDHPEQLFCRKMRIKMTKRDELLNEILSQNNLKLLSIAGTHGKTTTTAMAIWLFKQLGLPISYSVGAKIGFGEMGEFDKKSECFVYECDEFDRNFLAFHPYLSIITGLAYDHHEIFPSLENYNQAFKQFVSQSQRVVLYEEDLKKLNPPEADKSNFSLQLVSEPSIEKIKLPGLYNRRNAWLALRAVHELTHRPEAELVEIVSNFPGVSRRFEKVADNIYSDYAHTPEKIVGMMSVAKEVAAKMNKKIAVVYEPLTNRRMHYLAAKHRDVFEGADKIYWVPSYLAREDPGLPTYSPARLIKNLSSDLQRIAQPSQMDKNLASSIKDDVRNGYLVVALSGGSGDSLDEWIRKEFAS